LMAISEVLMQLKEIATRAANEASGDRYAMGGTVAELLNELVDQSKTRIDERYLFSGFNTSTAPIETSTQVEDEELIAGPAAVAQDLAHGKIRQGTVVVKDETGTTTFVEGTDYSIDYATGRLTVLAGGGMLEGTRYLVSYETETMSSVEPADSVEGDIVRKVGWDQTVTVNLLATEVFQGNVDVFQVGIDLKNALWKDDVEAVGDLLDRLDGAITQITDLLGVVGMRAQSLEGNQLRLEGDEVTLEGFISGIEDADLASAVVRLQVEQTAYQSALAATARLMQMSLVNFL
jgi:flagellin-like hook-associated protein FlgL